MSKPNVGILATKDWVISLINKVIKKRESNIKIFSKVKNNVFCAKNTSVQLISLNLAEGTYVITSSFRIENTNIRYSFSMIDVRTSTYDSSGWVAGNLSTIIEVPTSGYNATAWIYINDKNVTVNEVSIKAIKIK